MSLTLWRLSRWRRALGVADEAGAPGAGRLRRRAAAVHHRRRRSRVPIIDDYGHHPVEIANVLAAARSVSGGRVVAVVQPHRYSRLRDLFQEFCRCFNDADVVIVADVYAGGRELLIEGARPRRPGRGLRRGATAGRRRSAAPTPWRPWPSRWRRAERPAGLPGPATSPPGPTLCPGSSRGAGGGADGTGVRPRRRAAGGR